MVTLVITTKADIMWLYDDDEYDDDNVDDEYENGDDIVDNNDN